MCVHLCVHIFLVVHVLGTIGCWYADFFIIRYNLERDEYRKVYKAIGKGFAFVTNVYQIKSWTDIV